jgi:hypothetical protein
MDHFAFEFGNRVGGFLDAATSTDVATAIDQIADCAADEVQRIRKALATPFNMARELAANPGAGGWDSLHAAIAAAVAGQLDFARQVLARVEQPGPDAPEWQARFWQEVLQLRSELDNPTALETRLSAAVRESRAVLKLPEWTGSLPFLRGP